LSPQARGLVDLHLAHCPACRAEVEAVAHLADVLDAAPRTLDAALAERRARLWGEVWARVAPPAPAAAGPRPQGRTAWAMGLAMCVLIVTGLLASPFQRGVLAAASDPPLAVIQTPAAPRSSLTSLPGEAGASHTFDSTATLVQQTGQTPAPIPNPSH
jgi:hypothetical protein